ncbi:MAG: SUMF1/EgtB/PvdO family nonheme iron enzyme [Alphaproteobacteria bacterium]|nr:SUMF1/EgtB/PvdO family nonheme iron enzyme [Alphaproteobacteria bacterium]
MHLSIALLLLACAGDPPAPAPAGPAHPPDPSTTAPVDPATAPTGEPGSPPAQVLPRASEPDRSEPPGGWPAPADAPGCPTGMARIAGADGAFCIHRFELSVTGLLGDHDRAGRWPDDTTGLVVTLRSAAGEVPSPGISWYQAHAACKAHGMHLCTSQEWEDACDGTPGPGGRAHPVDGDPLLLCNIGHPQGVLRASGGMPTCVTPEGVYDLEGNLWEWTDPGERDDAGLPRIDKRGGGFYSGDVAGCAKGAIGSHAPEFDGTIGFRCCMPADADRGGPAPG